MGQLCSAAMPCISDWETALDFCLGEMISLGYDYRYEQDTNGGDTDLTKVRIWDVNCSTEPLEKTITIKLGINFTITCPQ